MSRVAYDENQYIKYYVQHSQLTAALCLLCLQLPTVLALDVVRFMIRLTDMAVQYHFIITLSCCRATDL